MNRVFLRYCNMAAKAVLYNIKFRN